ncbi:hypothetical protein F3Y22_tig00116997pilonHSYRG00309 [Hibiscus syriacus]|uniref:Gelsolin-like domain-containing protein n=1 Tax=Hibiscus syriacus TaxID=106335 RepID=A0A6A2XEA2_HIBSY|nr:hypothetical protein F3Y22_tig00116997pilonHSYRG00309 [Hibiscus syriacus]
MPFVSFFIICLFLQEDRADAIFYMNAIVDSSRGDPIMGGISAGYKRFIAETGIDDDTYDEKEMALFRIQGTSPGNMQAIQVDHTPENHMPALLFLLFADNPPDSSYCYILPSGTSVFCWIGNLTSSKDHDLDRMIELINPSRQPVSVREGSEPDSFWSSLGGKTEYRREKEMKFCC